MLSDSKRNAKHIKERLIFIKEASPCHHLYTVNIMWLSSLTLAINKSSSTLTTEKEVRFLKEEEEERVLTASFILCSRYKETIGIKN